MAVEGVSGSCGSEVNMFIHDSSGDEQTYIPHLSDSFFQSKFKIDPNDFYTFHDSDVIASEITVSHTEDNLIFSDSIDVKSKLLDSPNKDLDLMGVLTNGDVKEEIEETKNGHYALIKNTHLDINTNSKNTNTKVLNTKSQTFFAKESSRTNITENRHPSVNNLKVQNNINAPSHSVKVSINSVNPSNVKSVSNAKISGPETFLDVFKREQGVIEGLTMAIKTEPVVAPSLKIPTPISKKQSTGKQVTTGNFVVNLITVICVNVKTINLTVYT